MHGDSFMEKFEAVRRIAAAHEEEGPSGSTDISPIPPTPKAKSWSDLSKEEKAEKLAAARAEGFAAAKRKMEAETAATSAETLALSERNVGTSIRERGFYFSSWGPCCA